MAIARLSTGEVYTKHSDINGLAAPVQVGRFAFSEELEQGIDKLAIPLTREGADYVLSNFDPDAETMMKDAGFSSQLCDHCTITNRTAVCTIEWL